MSSSKWRRGRRSGSCRCWLGSSSNNLLLPDELLEEILSRLPVKSLIRFRCVKKSWSANFQQPSFIAKHFRHRCDQASPSLLVESNLFPGYGLSLHPYPDDEDVERFRIVDFPNDMGITELQHINMIGCINGIICLGGCFNGGFDGFVLWNPAIRKRKVVSYPSPTVCAAHLRPSHHFRTFYAFGYDQYFNDFKVVRIVTCNKKSAPTQNAIFTDYCNFFHVYSLKADSWTQVDPDIHHLNIRLITRCYAIYFNGFHHWLGFLDNGDINELEQNCDCEIILSFDMSNDVFRIMRLPDEVFRKLRYPELDNVSRMNKIFSVFNDRLAFIVYKDEDTMTEKYFDIWVMREYGVEDSWTKQLVVGPLLGIERPLQFAKNGELLLVGDDDAIVLYNIGSKEIRNLQLTKLPKSFIPVQAMVYVESLVSFTGENVF